MTRHKVPTRCIGSRKFKMRGVRMGLFALVGVLVAVADLSPAAISSPTNPQDLRMLAPVLEVKLKEWIVAWRTVLPGFSMTQFQKSYTSKGFLDGPWQSAILVAVQSNPLRPLYAVSRDGRWIVNPYSHLYLHGSELSSDIDTAVLLIDRKVLKQREILSCGTTCEFDDAAWVSNDIFFVVGHGERHSNTCPGGYWLAAPNLASFDIQRNSYIVYHYTGPEPKSCQGISDYVGQKVKKKIPSVK